MSLVGARKHRWSSITGDDAFGYPFLGAQGVGGFQKPVLLGFARLPVTSLATEV